MEIAVGKTQSVSMMLDDVSQVGEARRRAITLADNLGFSDTESGKAGIVMTEAANNIVKHAGRGQIILSVLWHEGVAGVEILALDKGPGMADVERCMTDGYSTAGSPGTGLGAMKRLSASFDVYSQPQKGTALVVRLWAAPPASSADVIGAACVPVAGETACGDGWAFHRWGANLSIIAIDGLGHGEQAAKAAQEAIRVFNDNPERAPAEIIRIVHGALLSTRGAAVAVASMHGESGELRFAGVGNISGMMYDGQKIRGLPSFNGTVGHKIYKTQELSYPWAPRGWLVLHSDGLYNRWKLDDYPGIIRHHPSLIAGILYRDFQRGRDDAMAVVTLNNG